MRRRLGLLVGVVEEVEVDELLDLERLRRHILDYLPAFVVLFRRK